jgi:hypothetical protein
MRYIRGFVIVFALLFSLAAALPVYAADSYFNVSGCSDDPTQLCTASGDGVNTNVPLTGFWYEAGASIAQLLGEKTMKWAGKLWPKDHYLIGKEKLNIYGNQVQTSSDTDLNPAELQTREQHDQTPKPFSMTSRLCVYDPSDGTLIGEGIVSTTTVKSDEVQWIRPKVEGDRRLSSFTTRYVQESQDFRLQYIMIHQDAALPCDSKREGEEKPQNDTAYRDDNTYGDSANPILIFIHVVESMIRTITHNDGSTSYESNVPVPAEIVGTGQNPFTGHDSALSAGCATSSDLSDVTYATSEQKQKLCESGGHTNSMYRPATISATYKSDLDADDPTQQWIQTVTGDEPIAPNSNAFAARVEAAGDYMNCTLMPADYQNTAVPDGSCNKNWVEGASSAPGSPAAGGWNCDASVPAQSVPGVNLSTAQSFVNRWFNTCPNATANAWQQCVNDVIARAKKACVDPLFTLAIWIHESGASNYQCSEAMHSGAKVQDFGININSIAENISEQLNRFVQLPSAYTGNCPDKTLQNFLARFSVGHYTPSGHYLCYNELSVAEKKVVDDYIGELQLIYSGIAPGVPLPTWPGISGCTPS